MPKIHNIDAIDWSLPELAKEHDQLNATYAEKDEFNKYQSFYKLKEAFEFIKTKKSYNNILDVGCGAAWHLVYLERENILNNTSCFGIDISPEMCKRAKKNYPNGIFIATDFINNSLNKKFDVVMESAVLELVHDWEAVLKAMLNHSNEWVILHRLFFTPDITRYEQVSTYNNLPDIRIHIGLNDLNNILNEYKFEITNEDKWNVSKAYKMGTFIIRRKNA